MGMMGGSSHVKRGNSAACLAVGTVSVGGWRQRGEKTNGKDNDGSLGLGSCRIAFA